MFERKGEKLGSIFHGDVEPDAEQPEEEPKKTVKQSAVKKAASKKAPKPEPKSEPQPEPEPEPDESFKSALDAPESDEPARNASTEEWAEFLDKQKVQYPEGAGREELIELFDNREK